MIGGQFQTNQLQKAVDFSRNENTFLNQTIKSLKWQVLDLPSRKRMKLRISLKSVKPSAFQSRRFSRTSKPTKPTILRCEISTNSKSTTKPTVFRIGTNKKT